MSILLSILSLVAIPTAAFHGRGYRGMYIAVALATGILGFIVLSMPVGVPTGATLAEIRGAEALDTYAPSIGGWFIVTAFASTVAAALFRPRKESNG